MRKYIVLLILALGFSCNELSVPAEYLQPEELSVLVEEISVLEAHYQSTYGVPGQYKNALDQAVSIVLKQHHCTLPKFKKSVYYYAAHPALQKLLNEKTMTRLSRKI